MKRFVGSEGCGRRVRVSYLGWLLTALVSSVVSEAFSQSTPASPKEQEHQPSVAEIARNFTNYIKITKTPVDVDAQFFSACAPPVRTLEEDFGPHAHASVLIYMNESASEAFKSHSKAYPVGAVIIKQKAVASAYAPANVSKGVPHGVGGMVKRSAGYDSAHGDWEYFYFEDPAKIESGPMASCVKCHDAVKDSDRVFGSWRYSANFDPAPK